jgi:hypothetical protein
MFCICAATYLGSRGLESARMSARIKSVLNVSNVPEHFYLGNSMNKGKKKGRGPALDPGPVWS